MNRVFTILTTLSLLVALGSTSLYAHPNKLTLDIPFDFTVGTQILPAGEYTVMPITGLAANIVLQIQSADDREVAAFLTMLVEDAKHRYEKGRLVFTRYGNDYFLSQIWWAGRASGHQLMKSSSEREVAVNATRSSALVQAR